MAALLPRRLWQVPVTSHLGPPLGGVVTIATTGVAVASALRRQDIWLAPWLWLAIALVGAVISGCALWRRAFPHPTMDEKHADWIRSLLRSTLASVQAGVECRYPNAHEKNRFLVHLRKDPEIGQLLSGMGGVA